LPVWTAVLALLLALWTFTSNLAKGSRWPIWLIFLAVAVILNVTDQRKLWISKLLFYLFRNTLPPISRTEREALEAGTVWWDGELFSGNPDWEKLLSQPKPRLTAGFFLPAKLDEALGRLADALVKVIAAEPVQQRLRAAVKEGRIGKGTEEEILEAGPQAGIITGDEANLEQLAVETRREVIRVDDFPALGRMA
jgi:hypothetical protein